MSSTGIFEETIENLKKLKLPAIREELDDRLRLAQSKSLTHLEFLYGLTEEELKGRERANYMRRLKGAKLPAVKNLDDFQFAFQPSLKREKIENLKDCRWAANAENIIFAGQSGTGKTHLAISMAIEALKQGYKVYFTSVADLMDQAGKAEICGRIPHLHKKLSKQDVIVLDELGYLKLSQEQGNFLFRLVSKAYERRSLIITTNKDFSGRREIFADPVQAAAMLDRILHHCRIFTINGDSYRVRNPEKSEEVDEK